MMRIRYMRMRVPPVLVVMAVAVRSSRHRVVSMEVMVVVVRVGVLMLKHTVFVVVTMRLGQMQDNTRQHHHAANAHPPTQ